MEPRHAIPRRLRIDRFTPAEKAIWDAAQAVEATAAHPLLTEALNLLHAARGKVADFHDRVVAPLSPSNKEEPRP